MKNFIYIMMTVGAALSLIVLAAHVGILRIAFVVIAFCVVWAAGWWAWIRPYGKLKD